MGMLARAGQFALICLAVIGVFSILGADPHGVVESVSGESINVTEAINDSLAAIDREEVDTQATARAVYVRTNAVRREQGRSRVEWSPELAEVARRHSQNMAEHGYLGHTQPNGETSSHRLKGTIPACDSARAENVNKAYWHRDYVVHGTDETWYITNETRLAKALVISWLNSEQHADLMLREEWSYTGVGVATNTSTNAVYATQVFC